MSDSWQAMRYPLWLLQRIARPSVSDHSGYRHTQDGCRSMWHSCPTHHPRLDSTWECRLLARVDTAVWQRRQRLQAFLRQGDRVKWGGLNLIVTMEVSGVYLCTSVSLYMCVCLCVCVRNGGVELSMAYGWKKTLTCFPCWAEGLFESLVQGPTCSKGLWCQWMGLYVAEAYGGTLHIIYYSCSAVCFHKQRYSPTN